MEELKAKVPSSKEEFVQDLIFKVKSELRHSPLVSNAFFAFALLYLEEFTEKEFACPCNIVWNSLFAAVYLFVPAVLVLLLMVSIKCFQNKTDIKECEECCCSIFGPSIFWIIIVLWDGQTLACAMTNWSGSYEEIHDAAPQKWCEPANLTSSQEFDYKTKTQLWFFMSQAIGLGLIIIVTVVLLVHLICKRTYKACGKYCGMCCGKCCPDEIRRDPDTPLQEI